MKKRYRIGICLALIICLLLLSACGSKPDASAKDSATSANTDNSQKENADTTDSAESITQPSESDDPVQGDNKQPTAIKIGFKDSYVQLEKWESTSLFKGKELTYETCKTYADGILEHHGVTYGQDYFNDRSLILVELMPDNTLSAGSKIWAVTDVRYENGIVYCSITQIANTDDPIHNTEYKPIPDFVFWACFIEIDFAIPDGTEIEVEFDDVYLENESFKVKETEFKAKGI